MRDYAAGPDVRLVDGEQNQPAARCVVRGVSRWDRCWRRVDRASPSRCSRRDSNPLRRHNRAPLAIHFDSEISRPQIRDGPAVAVDDRDVDRDDFDAALEPGRLLILGIRRLRSDKRYGKDDMKSSHNCTSSISGPASCRYLAP
jgi:hypothetical protein